MKSMTHSREFSGSGRQEPMSIDALHRIGLIACGRKKLIDAQMKDLALGAVDVQGTHRFAHESTVTMAGERVHHGRTTLVPEAHDSGQPTLHRLDIWFPLVRWKDATPLQKDVYQNMLHADDFDRYTASKLSKPRALPTFNMFGKAHHISGEQVKFLVTPTLATTYDLLAEVRKLPNDKQALGIGYTIEHTSMYTHENEQKFHDWFTLESLTDIVEKLEPTIDGGGLRHSA